MSQTLISGYGCIICSDVFDVNVQRNICTIPQCGHVYHEHCVKRWFRTQIEQGTQSSCPKCRAPAQENETIRLFLHETVTDTNSDDANGTNEQNHDDDNDSNGDNHEAIDVWDSQTASDDWQMATDDWQWANTQDVFTFDDDVFSFSNRWGWFEPSHPLFHDHAYSLHAIDQRLRLMNLDVSEMTAMVNRLEVFLQTIN